MGVIIPRAELSVAVHSLCPHPVSQRINFRLNFGHLYAVSSVCTPQILVSCLFPRMSPQESSKKEVLRVCGQMDELMEEAKDEAANGTQVTSRRR